MPRDSYTPRLDSWGIGNTENLGDIVATGPPPRVYPEGRVCEHEGCDTRLSIYNSGDNCSLHKGGKGKPSSANKSG